MMKEHNRSHGWLRLAAALSLAAVCLRAAPAGPVPQIPEGGAAPGPFPNTSVTAINVIARGSSTAFDGRVDISGIEGQGPISWSVNRYNRGDFALRLSPANPAAALGNLGQGFIEYAETAASLPVHHAWRPHSQLGVIIPTARQNGPIDWNDGEGPFFPTVAIAQASSAPGYSMVDGAFANGDFDLNTGRAGTHDSSPEANFAFSATWFPYDQGWIGGDAASPTDTGASGWARPAAHAVGISPGFVKWRDFPTGSLIFGGVAEMSLPGVNTLTNGMLFTTSSDGGSDVNIVGVAPKEDGSAWVVTVREDSATDAETLAVAGQSEFQFVYVPYTANNLVGGRINGSNGAKLQSKGDFTMTRASAGIYELAIPGKTASSGTLLLQVADFEAGTSELLASRAFLSYQFTDGKFVIQSRKTTSDTEAALADASFYFAWIDFQTPLSLPDGPRLRSLPAVAVTPADITAKESGIAINTDAPEILVTVVDDQNFGGYIDPITSQFAVSVVFGQFFNPTNFAALGEPFVILGNPGGMITRHDVKYNPVSKQYVVAANARAYGPGALNIPLLALVNTNGAASALAKTWVYDENTQVNYDDVALAVSSRNGNFILAAEYAFPGESEGTVGILFDKAGTQLTPQFGRLDLLQGPGDEDDPEVTYLESVDAFFYSANTDKSDGVVNRLAGSIIQTVPGANGALQTQTEKLLGDGLPAGASEGHPSAMINPFNGELINAFDLGGNNVATGDLSFIRIGPAPDYAFTVARPEISYLAGTAGNPLRHNHPQLAADPDHEVIAVGFNARQSDLGYPDAYAFTLLDKNGALLPNPSGVPYYLADAPGSIDSGPNRHNIKYSPTTDSFIVAYNTLNPGVVYLTGFQVTSAGGGSSGPAPALAAKKTGSNIEITWPSNAAGFVLESSPVIVPAVWTAVGTAPVAEGALLKATLPADGAARFYRLRRP